MDNNEVLIWYLLISDKPFLFHDLFWPHRFSVLNVFFFVRLSKTPGYFPMCPLKLAFEKCQFCFFPLDFVISCFIYSYVNKKVMLPLSLIRYDPHNQGCYSINRQVEYQQLLISLKCLKKLFLQRNILKLKTLF